MVFVNPSIARKANSNIITTKNKDKLYLPKKKKRIKISFDVLGKT
jgi:hypothetical protein